MEDSQIAAEVIKKEAKDWLIDNYATFAAYVVHDRAIVNDDGCKPVNKRILYAMYNSRLYPTAKFLKAAQVAARTMAYHPHGNASIEDALALMAQKFYMRVPLVDCYGNVGYVTGDEAAAARYWEARLTPAAMELLTELDDHAAPIGTNYDGDLAEPEFLPARWPNAIINGSSGIAVGYASSMIPHNPTEIMDALIKLTEKPSLSVDELLEIAPGPDFPTGGEAFGAEGIREYYETGRGHFVVRGKYRTEQMSCGRVRYIFYELPYKVSAEDVKSAIAAAKNKGKLLDVSKANDFTDKKSGLRLVIETKSGSNPKVVLNDLFKLTPLETAFNVNINTLYNDMPKQFGMLDLLRNFIDFRRACVIRKLEYRLEKIDSRLIQVDALLAALLDIDKAISIIRNSDTVDVARKELMREFELSEEQANYILSMQLRRLTKADSVEIQKEKDSLIAEQNDIRETLTDDKKVLKIIRQNLRETKKVIADERRTIINTSTLDELKEESSQVDKIAKAATKAAPCWVTRFANGTVTRSAKPIAYSSGDDVLKNLPIVEEILTDTQANVGVVFDDGSVYSIPVSYIHERKGCRAKELGVRDTTLNVVGITKLSNFAKTDKGVAIVTRNGLVKIAKLDTFPNKETFTIINLSDGDKVVNTCYLSGSVEDYSFAIVSTLRTVRFPASTVRPSGYNAAGISGMKLKGDDYVVGANLVNEKDPNNVIVSNTNLAMKITPYSSIPLSGRSSVGVILQKLLKGETGVRAAYTGSVDNLVITLDNGTVVNMPPVTERATSGMRFGMEAFFGKLKSVTDGETDTVTSGTKAETKDDSPNPLF